MGPEGLEQSGLTASQTSISENTRTESGTVDDETSENDPDLARLTKAWPDLPKHLKQAIRAIVQSFSGDETEGDK